MSPRKVRAGVSFDPPLVEILDGHARRLAHIEVDRSEIVNAILEDYLERNGTADGVWDAVSKRRIKLRAVEGGDSS